MANTTTNNGKFFTITFDGTTDWLFSSDLPAQLRQVCHVKWIRYSPSGVDILIIHDGTIDGPEIFRATTTATTDERIQYFGDEGSPMRMVVDASDCTWATVANARLSFEVV